MTKTPIANLIERVKAEIGPCRRIDAEIYCTFCSPDLRPAERGDHSDSIHCRDRKFNPGDIWCPTGFLTAPLYTSRLDEIIHLIEAKSPGWGYWTVSKGKCREDEPLYAACIAPTVATHEENGIIVEHEASAPLALLLAFLTVRQMLDQQQPECIGEVRP